MSEENKEIHKPDCSKMEYRYLGNSGLRVSVVGFGNWVNNLNDESTKECFNPFKISKIFLIYYIT